MQSLCDFKLMFKVIQGQDRKLLVEHKDRDHVCICKK